MANYSEQLKSQKEKRQQKFYTKLAYFTVAFLLAFMILQTMGYHLEEMFFRNTPKEMYFSKKFLQPAINYFLQLVHAIGNSVTYIFSAKSDSNITMDNFQHVFFAPFHNIYYKPDFIAIYRMDIDPTREGFFAISSAIVFVSLYIYLFLLFRGKERAYKKIIYYPLSALFFSNLDKHEQKQFMFKGGWVESFKKNMFNRIIEIEDGYQRVETLEYWVNYKEILSGKNNSFKKCFIFIEHLFLSKEKLEDLFFIVEGYMAPTKKRPTKSKNYLKLLIGGEEANNINYNHPFLFDKEIVVEENEWPTYKCFNGKDEVTFSTQAISMFLDQETQNFIKTLRTRGLKSKSGLAGKVNDFIKNFRKHPERYRKMLFGINNKKTELVDDLTLYKEFEKNEANASRETIENRLLFVLSSYFRIIALREIIQKYMNLPAGTIVVKINDYTLRMIFDSYINRSLIQIEKSKNDGSSKEFESDILANLFIYAFWYFNDSFGEKTFMDRLNYHFNTDAITFDDDETVEKWLSTDKK